LLSVSTPAEVGEVVGDEVARVVCGPVDDVHAIAAAA